jgi:hypothetical protein
MVVLLCRCQSTLGACYKNGNWPCVAVECQHQAASKAASRDCVHHIARIRFEQALHDRNSSLSHVDNELRSALAAMRDATSVHPRRDFEIQDRNAQEQFDAFEADSEEEWHTRVEAEANLERKVKAAYDHENFYGRRTDVCHHRVDELKREYVHHYTAQSLAEKRSALGELEGTSVADELFDAYTNQRLEGYAGRELILREIRELEILREIRQEFEHTAYGGRADQRLKSEFETISAKEKDAEKLERICIEAPDDRLRTECDERVQEAWTREGESAADPRRLKTICDEHLHAKPFELCTVTLGERTVEAYTEAPVAYEKLLAAVCLQEENAPCRLHAKKALFREEAERVMGELDVDKDGRPGRGSTDQWRNYIKVFDELARKLFGHDATLQSIADETYQTARERIDSIASHCTDEVISAKPSCTAPDLPLDQSDHCIARVIEILNQDQENLDGKRLLSTLYSRRRELSKRSSLLDWGTTTLLLIGSSQVLRSVITDAAFLDAARVVARQVIGH